MTSYYCCESFETADDDSIKYLTKEDTDEYQTIDKPGWYLWNDEYKLQHPDPIQHCPWCGVRLDKSYERMAGKS